MKIRAAGAADAEAVFAMLTRFAMSYDPDPGAFERFFGAMIESPDVALLVADGGGALAGYVMAVEFATLFANGDIVQIEELSSRRRSAASVRAGRSSPPSSNGPATAVR